VRSALSASSGYLASIVTSDAPFCARHPWVVRSAPGQRINITLWDFTVATGSASLIVTGGKGKGTGAVADSLESGSDYLRKFSMVDEVGVFTLEEDRLS